MSINARHAVNKTKPYLGRFWNSIDFEYTNFNEEAFKENYKGVVIGHFVIGNSRFPVTYSELSRIIETCADAQDSLNTRLRLGITK